MAQAGYNEYFFIKRFPFRKKYWIRHSTWKKPDRPDDYDNRIREDNFVSQADLAAENIPDSSTSNDIETLKKYLLDDYFQADHEAKYHQGVYFRYQWVLILLSFISTLVVTIAIALSPEAVSINVASSDVISTESVAPDTGNADPLDQSTENQVQETLPDGTTSPVLITIVTGVAAALTTLFTAFNQGERPQPNWYRARTIAEELRRVYFLYLAHLPPYDKDDHVSILRQQVANIATGESEVSSTGIVARPALTPQELTAFVKLYNTKRIAFQNGFYTNCKAEFDRNSKFVWRGGLFLGAVGVIIAIINGLSGSQLVWVLAVALMPIFAALLASFEKIYGWSRQAALYEDAINRLKRDRALSPEEGVPTFDSLAKFVTRVEQTLKSEMNQWGQLAPEET